MQLPDWPVVGVNLLWDFGENLFLTMSAGEIYRYCRKSSVSPEKLLKV
jgi:hypothetical protein